MAKPNKQPLYFSIESAEGLEFVPVGKGTLVPSYRRLPEIVCLPIPGKNGIDYVPEWFGITHFG